MPKRRTESEHRALRLDRLLAAVVAIAVVAAFLPALRNGFVSWDDANNFVDNTAYRGLSPANLKWMWTTTLMGHYVPLTWMTLGLDYALWGMNPLGYHLTSLVLHAVAAVLLFFVARRLLRAAAPAVFASDVRGDAAAATAALLWALHPLRVESVAWATERRDVLSCLFFLASLLAFLRAVDGPRLAMRRYWLAVGLFACSLLSKATSMTLPAVLLLLDVYPLRRLGGARGWWSDANRRVYVEIVPFAVAAAAAALVSILVLHPPAQLGLGGKFAVSAYSLVFYVWKTIAPFDLSPLYEMPSHVDAAAPRFLASYLIVAAGIAGAWVARRRHPGFATTVAAFVIVTLPMLGIVQNGPQIAADRYTYYGAPALAIAAAGWLFARTTVRAAVALVVVALAGLTAVTWNQVAVWHDSLALWSRVVSLDSSSSFGHVGLARIAFAENDMPGAIEHYERAVEIDPTYAEGYNNMGNALLREGRVDDAIREYRRALAVDSNFTAAHNGLGSALAQRDRVAEAIAEFRRTLAIDPRNADAHNDWGAALAGLGDAAGAIEQYRAAIALDSTRADAYTNWGNALVRLGRPRDAEALYATAIRLRPDDGDTHRNLGVALAQEHEWNRAANEFREALTLQPSDDQASLYLERVEAEHP